MVKKKKEEQIKQTEIDKKEADFAAEEASKTVLKVLPVVPVVPVAAAGVAAAKAAAAAETPSLLHGFDASDDQDIVFK